MATTLSSPRSFKAAVETGAKGAVVIRLPFEPAAQWGARAVYHLGGTVDGKPVRTRVTADERIMVLGPAWLRDNGVQPGDRVAVTVALEGPQRGDLDADFAAALDAEPDAATFFENLAQFYRKGYLTWINATTKKPEERARRIKETVRLLKAGQKSRPR